MQFNSWDVGQQPAGAVVEVTLSGNAANVRLLNSSNFSAFKAGRQHRYTGGHATRSPVRLQIPASGHWHVVVDYGGNPGRGRAGVRVLPGNLPQLRQRSLPSLAPMAESVAALAMDQDQQPKEWDVFISHASEDKNDVVRPLALAMQNHGLRVWYDEFELRIGDSLRRKIDQDISQSAFGIVILSEAFLRKK